MDETCRPWSILSASVSGLAREALAVWRRLQGDPARVPLHRRPAQQPSPETGQPPRVRRVQHDLADPADRPRVVIVHQPMMNGAALTTHAKLPSAFAAP